ncbi:F-actin-capping protein subunit alpha [Symbiodinium microadriaticum]|uniref:F-actin-capping protein subunit alpha n=2 Tax=Symbiodinium TaxID=2949 RepID=A0A1Q9CZS0_SYMMI|nr:F-actin-capping protein subunit alpha [Symbiodinium microadriaticum]CAE7423562.1 cpa [Symbiodinium microadriaticum]
MAGAAFDESLSGTLQNFIQRSPPGHLPDVLARCRQLVAPATLPKDLVWRACAAHNERNFLIVRPPTEGAESGDLLVVHENGRAGSRAQQQVPYKDGLTDKLFAVDHERQECTRMWSQQKSDDLMAQMDNIDEEIAEPFKEALKSELRKYVDSRYADQGGMSTGAASYTLYSSKGQEVGGDIELTMIVAARRARPRGLWSGTWTSQWRTLFEPGQAEPVKMVGVLEFISHYAEDGNVHFRRRAESRSSVSETSDPAKFAVEVVKAIRREEDSFQESTEDQCDSLCDGTLRALRRTLPVSKERFDWRPSRHALVRDLKAAGKDGGS